MRARPVAAGSVHRRPGALRRAVSACRRVGGDVAGAAAPGATWGHTVRLVRRSAVDRVEHPLWRDPPEPAATRRGPPSVDRGPPAASSDPAHPLPRGAFSAHHRDRPGGPRPPPRQRPRRLHPGTSTCRRSAGAAGHHLGPVPQREQARPRVPTAGSARVRDCG